MRQHASLAKQVAESIAGSAAPPTPTSATSASASGHGGGGVCPMCGLYIIGDSELVAHANNCADKTASSRRGSASGSGSGLSGSGKDSLLGSLFRGK